MAKYHNKEATEALGKNFKRLRLAAGFSIEDIVAMTGNPNASATIVSRMETGKNVEFWRYIKAAQTLQVPLRYFFKNGEPVPSKPYIDHLSYKERLDYELKRIGKILRASRKAQSKVLGDFERKIGVGIDPSNVSKLERGLANARLDTIELALKEVNKTIEETLNGN